MRTGVDRVLVFALLACTACKADRHTSVAIAVLNLEEGPQRIVKVCVAKRCTDVHAVLEHGDEAIVTLTPGDDAEIAFTVEDRTGTRVAPCRVRLRAGWTGGLKVALSERKVKVLENALQPPRNE